MSFSSGVRRSTRKIRGQMEAHARAVIIDLFTRVIMRSPVDKGRFRANWNTTLNGVDRSVSDDLFSLTVALDKVDSAVSGLELGDDAVLANNLPYAIPLENGWSAQAPGGMIRVSLIEVAD